MQQIRLVVCLLVLQLYAHLAHSSSIQCLQIFQNEVSRTAHNYIVQKYGISIEEQSRILEEKKYSPEVADRIVRLRPDVAEAIIFDSKILDTRPLTLYRGMRIKPEKYNPRRTTREFGGEIYLSEDLNKAAIFAERYADTWYKMKHPAYQTIVKFQVPRFLLSDTNISRNRAQVYWRKDIPDDSPFIVKIGAVRDYGLRYFYKESDLLWIDFDENYPKATDSLGLPPLKPFTKFKGWFQMREDLRKGIIE